MDENELGPQLVNILYKNTNMNYDICADNLIKIFTYLERNVERLESRNLKLLLNSIKTSICDPTANPDFNKFDQHFFYLNNIKEELKSGDSSYKDYEDKLENILNNIINVLSNPSSLRTFTNYFSSNREFSFTLYEIWKLLSNNQLKSTLIQLLTTIFYSDNDLITVLYHNTNIILDLCFNLKEQINLKDIGGIFSSLNCLCYFLNNIPIICPEKLSEGLKNLNLLDDIFCLIEKNDEFIYQDMNQFSLNKNSYFPQKKESKITLLNQLIFFILSLNSKFSLPEENIVLHFLHGSSSDSSDYTIFSENIVFLFNLENDPLSRYKILKPESMDQTFFNNCLIKIVSDLFSSKKNEKPTSIFYYNDFKVLIDVIIRKLSNLSATDQIRSDYLSLIQLIIKNSSYVEQMYKIDELLSCFNMILSEKDDFTIDQDIVRIILSETPELLTK